MAVDEGKEVSPYSKSEEGKLDMLAR